jgi:hypothetical protein
VTHHAFVCIISSNFAGTSAVTTHVTRSALFICIILSIPGGTSVHGGRSLTTLSMMNTSFSAADFDANGDFAAPLLDNINWDDPALYTMPLTDDEIAAIVGDIAATNFPVIPKLPTHPSLSDPPPHTPSPHPSECSSLDHDPPDPPSPTCAGPLREANSSSWAAHNPTRPVLRPRTPPPRLTDAQKASRKIKRDQKHEAAKHLHDGVVQYLNEQRLKIEALARTHNVTSKHVNDIIGSQTNYHKSRKPQLINALVHAKAKEMNAGKSR